MNVAAAIVHFGDPALTQTGIVSLLSCNALDRIVVVLHDTYPLERDPRVAWIESLNRGYAAGLNLAVQHLQTAQPVQHVLAMNPDVQLKPEQIEKLLEHHREQNSACTFPVLRENSHLIYGYRFSRLGTLKRVQQNPQWYSGACFVFSIDVWKKTGGFDPTFFHYFEDQDFCQRVKKLGLPIYQAVDVVVDHDGKSGADYPATDLPRFAVRNHLIALSRTDHLGAAAFLNVITRHFFYLFRWKRGWRGIRSWLNGIRDFISLVNVRSSV